MNADESSLSGQKTKWVLWKFSLLTTYLASVIAISYWKKKLKHNFKKTAAQEEYQFYETRQVLPFKLYCLYHLMTRTFFSDSQKDIRKQFCFDCSHFYTAFCCSFQFLFYYLSYLFKNLNNSFHSLSSDKFIGHFLRKMPIGCFTSSEVGKMARVDTYSIQKGCSL